MVQTISQIMTPDPVTCDAEDPVVEAARAMKQHAMGDVIVLEGGRLGGLVTDRDLVVRVMAEGRDPASTPLRAVCSNHVKTLSPSDDVARAVELVSQQAVRRIPIVDGDAVVGVVSLGDLAIERDERSALASVSAAPPNA
jgi:CBS domain-containing protein